MQNWQFFPLSREGRTLILDTDIGPDCDDTGALALLMEYRRRFSFPVAGVVNCTANPWANGAIRAITRFLGEELAVAQAAAGDLLADAVKFDRSLTEKYLPDPASAVRAPASTDYYLDALARAADDSVVIVSIGQFTAVDGLLSADPELVRCKVHALVSMACAFPTGREFNVFMDAPAAQRVFERFPRPIICSGFEVGLEVLTGYEVPPANAAHNPVYDAYRLYLDDGVLLRPSWDLTAVQFAVEGPGDFYTLSEPLSVRIGADGSNEAVPWDGSGAPRYCLRRKTDAQALAVHLNALLHTADNY